MKWKMTPRKNKPEAIKASNEKIRAQMAFIGPITSKQFGKMQTVLNDYNENVRMICLWNMLVMMKEMDEKQ